MKAVLLSIKPEYCGLIANGDKTIEVRKTRPKIETPFKCYIYETKAINHHSILVDLDGEQRTIFAKGRGKIIGEFICDRIVKAECGQYCRLLSVLYTQILPQELFNYANYKPVYGWHISDLKIYGKPKELSEFRKAGGRQCVSDNGICCRYIQASPGDDPADANTMSCIYGEQNCPFEYLSRPPQSWCYVEERRKNNANL